MKISFKNILKLWIFLIIAICALLYAAYSKLNPDSLVKQLNQQFEKNYPGSQVKVDKVNYKFAIDFTLELQNLKIQRGSEQIADAALVEIKIPWWLLVFNKGSILVSLNNLNLYVSKSGPSEIVEKKRSGNSLVSFNLPGYLSDASYSLRIQHLAIKELGGDRNFFTLSKFLVRDFQYGKNSAFEINVPILITASGKRYSSELWLFGDVTPDIGEWILNYRGEFKTKDSSESFHFDDLVIDGKAKFNTASFDISSQLNLLIDKKEVGKGTLISHLDKMELGMKFTGMPIEYLLLAGNPIRNPYWEKMEGQGSGEITFTHHSEKENYFSLAGKVNFPGEFKFSDSLSIPGKWLLKFENSNWETSFISTAGEVNFFKRAAIDFSTGKINQYSQEIGLNGINLKDSLLPLDRIGTYLKNDEMIFHSTYLVIKKCQYGNSILDGFFLYGKNPEQKFYQSDLSTDTGKMSLKFISKDQIVNSFEMSFSSFPWDNYDFLNPIFSMEEGVIDGSIKGEWKEEVLKGNWLSRLQFGKIKNLKGEISELFMFLNKNFELDNSENTDIYFDGILANEVLKVKSYNLGIKNPAVLSGVLSLNSNIKSILSLAYPKNRSFKAQRKEIPNFIWAGANNE